MNAENEPSATIPAGIPMKTACFSLNDNCLIDSFHVFHISYFAPIQVSASTFAAADTPLLKSYSTGTPQALKDLQTDANGNLYDGAAQLYIDPQDTLEADLTTATAATINDLREAFQVQKLLERDARGGTRYSELVKNHFGVNFYDVSYRPEYLGGGISNVTISPIAQTAQTATSGTSDGTGSGDLAAMGYVHATGHGFTKSFVEHGIVMGIMSVTADITYQQGLHRFFSHSTRYDKYWPSLAHLGEQPVYNKEIYTQGTTADDDVFGYQERYAEYRYMPNRISGIFRSAYASNIDEWHLAQHFTSLPTLGNAFIKSETPLDRCIQVNTEPHFIFDSVIDIKAARPMPTFGTPGMIDHF